MRLKFAVLVFGLIFVSLGVVNACEDNQRIMRLYQENNSHGAVWNDTHGYDIEICYDDSLFDFGTYTEDLSTAHNCTADNDNILWLADEYNSHASLTSDDTYKTPVCYGNLICDNTFTTQEQCDAWEGKIILSLYSASNSHIAKGNNQYYPVKICCKIGTKITGAYWADMRERQLEAPDNIADLNDRVKLMVAGEGMRNREINYTIEREKPAWIIFKTWNEVASFSSLGFSTWKATEEGLYRFTAEIAGIGTQQSEDLIVLDTEDNSLPVANITSPQIGDIYFTGDSVSFEHASYDEDDEIASVLWDFGDGETSESDSDTHIYSTTKQKQIKLIVTDERNAEDEDRTSILIISQEDNDYVFAHIDEPEWGDNFFGSTIYFSAESSYGVGVSGCPSCTIDCLGGYCPSQTGSGTSVGNAPLSPDDADYNALTFSWKFDGGSSGVHKKKGYPGKNFTSVFGDPGRHTADLTVSMG